MNFETHLISIWQWSRESPQWGCKVLWIGQHTLTPLIYPNKHSSSLPLVPGVITETLHRSPAQPLTQPSLLSVHLHQRQHRIHTHTHMHTFVTTYALNHISNWSRSEETECQGRKRWSQWESRICLTSTELFSDPLYRRSEGDVQIHNSGQKSDDIFGNRPEHKRRRI